MILAEVVMDSEPQEVRAATNYCRHILQIETACFSNSCCLCVVGVCLQCPCSQLAKRGRASYVCVEQRII